PPRGPPPARSLVAPRRLPPPPPDTLIRAIAVVLGTAPENRSALYELCDSDQPLVAGPPTASSATTGGTRATRRGPCGPPGGRWKPSSNASSPTCRRLGTAGSVSSACRSSGVTRPGAT